MWKTPQRPASRVGEHDTIGCAKRELEKLLYFSYLSSSIKKKGAAIYMMKLISHNLTSQFERIDQKVMYK